MHSSSAFLVLAIAATISAAVPNTFTSGSPTKAADVNANFEALDSAIQNRAMKGDMGNAQAAILSLQASVATKSDLAALAAKEKADSATLAKAIPAPVDISDKANTAWVRDTLKSKQDALGFTPANKAGETFTGDVSIDKALTVASMVSAGGFQTGGNISSVGLKADTITAQSLTVAGNAAWHAGNFTPHSTSVSSLLPDSHIDGDVTSFDYNNPAGGPGLWINGFASTHGNYLHSFIINQHRTDNWFVGFSQEGASPRAPVWHQLVHSGNIAQFALASTGGTITGDLRISGKLTTNPGATPADYVFEPDYKLASLSEVEAFTKANKHLPEVPSAKEMTENGVDLAAMNMVLLKKVEELTLHAIALQKDVESQKAQMADQRKIMQEMKAALESIRND
jgi:hypothetical protein